ATRPALGTVRRPPSAGAGKVDLDQHRRGLLSASLGGGVRRLLRCGRPLLPGADGTRCLLWVSQMVVRSGRPPLLDRAAWRAGRSLPPGEGGLARPGRLGWVRGWADALPYHARSG